MVKDIRKYLKKLKIPYDINYQEADLNTFDKYKGVKTDNRIYHSFIFNKILYILK